MIKWICLANGYIRYAYIGIQNYLSRKKILKKWISKKIKRWKIYSLLYMFVIVNGYSLRDRFVIVCIKLKTNHCVYITFHIKS